MSISAGGSEEAAETAADDLVIFPVHGWTKDVLDPLRKDIVGQGTVAFSGDRPCRAVIYGPVDSPRHSLQAPTYVSIEIRTGDGLK